MINPFIIHEGKVYVVKDRDERIVLVHLKKECSAVKIVKQDEHVEKDQKEIYGSEKGIDFTQTFSG